MLTMKIESILASMRKHNYEADIQSETGQVYTILKINKREYPLFVRVFDEGHLLQLLVFIPCRIDQGLLGDMARLLHLFNKELDMPGFGMDEMAGAIFYRLMIPTPKKKLDEDLLIAFIKTVEHVCKMFATPIEAVASGQIALEEIIKKAQEINPESQKG